MKPSRKGKEPKKPKKSHKEEYELIFDDYAKQIEEEGDNISLTKSPTNFGSSDQLSVIPKGGRRRDSKYATTIPLEVEEKLEKSED